jgi:hypothetical protein
MARKITVTINNKFVSLESTGLSGDTLINHFLDKVVEVRDLIDGLERGYFTATVLNPILREVAKYQEWAAKHPVELRAANDNNMVGCVFSQKVSPRRTTVGWRFTLRGTNVGDIQQDAHALPYPHKIEWVAE